MKHLNRLADAAETHIYLGLGFLAGGVGGATQNVGAAFAVFGLGLILIGVARAAAPPPREMPRVTSRVAEAMSTAAPDERAA